MVMTRVLWVAAVCAAILAGSARPVLAQDERKVGLVMAYPTSVGVIWQISKRVAIRPDINGSWAWSDSSESESIGISFPAISIDQSTRSHSFGVGFSALVTVAQWDRLRAYVVPRVSYSRSVSRGEITYSGLPVGLPSSLLQALFRPSTFETKSSGTSYSASFGVQHGLTGRFAIFGEIGAAYASADLTFPAASASLSLGPPDASFIFLPEDTQSQPAPRHHSLGLRSGVGLIFFF